MRRTIEDLIILGRAVPEPIKDGRTTVCLGGYSHSLGFVRIYPTKTDMSWKRWDIVRVEVEKDDRDTREESWKIVGSRTEWKSLSQKIEVVGRLSDHNKRRNLVANLSDGCVNDINNNRRSLGIIKPTVLEKYFQKNQQYGRLFQMALPVLGESTKVKRDFPYEPRIKYRCSDCSVERYHDQQVLEWGFYEWLRKHPEESNQVWQIALFNSQEHDIFFFVGNQFRYRSSFMVISILRIRKGPITYPLTPYIKLAKE